MSTIPFRRRTEGAMVRSAPPSGIPAERRLRVLLVEDVASDAELAIRELHRAGMPCEVVRVDTEAAFLTQLRDFRADIILSDFAMPDFDGMQALALARRLQPSLPFIFVSGVMGEEYAIRALKDGATDYVLKNNLLRLPSAVERAVREAGEAAAREALEARLRQREKRHRELFQGNPHPMWIYDRETLRFLDVNDAAIKRYGYGRDEFLSMALDDIRRQDDAAAGQERLVTRSGDVRDVEITYQDIEMEGRPACFMVAYDVTERRRAQAELAASESRFRALIEQAVDGIFIIDKEGNFVLANTCGCEMLGYKREELIGLNGRFTYVEGEQPIHAQRMKEVLAGKTLQFERLIRRKDGSTFPADVSVKMLDNGAVQLIFHDITMRRQQHERILRLQRIQAVLGSIGSAIMRVQNRRELFEEACRIAAQHASFRIAWIALLQDNLLKPEAWAGPGSGFFAGIVKEGSDIVLSPGGLANRAVQARGPVLSNDITDNPNLDFVRRAAVDSGCKSAIALPLTDGGAPIGIFMLYCDQKDFFDEEEVRLLEQLAADVSFALTVITQREKVEFLAYYDPLTGLPNRALFFERLGRQLAAIHREKGKVALVVLDLDRFRMANDTLGRQGGDALLVEVARRLRGLVREEDTIARIGADTFAIAFEGDWRPEDLAHAIDVRGRKLFGLPFVIDGEELRVSASAGIAMAPGDGSTTELLLGNAEAALRNAKSRNERFLFYQPEMNRRAAENLRLENSLRQAMENDELVLWYQPKIDLATRKVTGFEALMRWEHPQSGLISPAQFIPLLEQTGLIVEAGSAALLRVARDCRAWTDKGVAVPRIAVNVSPLQLRRKSLVSTVIEAASLAEETGSALDLEITESVIMENVEAIVPILQTIRGQGVEIYVDDFGTGYSSLAYVARLPIHALKIDRSFVEGMMQSGESLAIVKSVISLAHALRLHVVAEGVETDEQAATLLKLGCDQAQGYLISPPVPAPEVPALLRRLANEARPKA